jgi:RNA polymerase sigma factor for flagellar operon FliA
MVDVAFPAEGRDRLVRQHLGLVQHIARRMSRAAGTTVELTDLVSAGMIGLLRAIDGFDASYNVAFSTYAAPRIRGAILDELRSLDHASRGARTQRRQIDRAEQLLSSRLLRAPRHSEVAQELGIGSDTLWQWKSGGASAVHVGFDEPAGPGVDFVADPAGVDVAEQLELREERLAQVEWLKDELRCIPERERIVLAMYYGEELTLRQIGEVLGITESRVSQLRTAALKRLRARNAARDEVAALQLCA